LEKNKKLLARVARIAEEKRCTTNQLALAWVIRKGAPMSVPIPGTTKLANLRSNVGALAVHLSPEEMQALEDAIPAAEVAGSRYGNVTREEQAAFLEESLSLARSTTF
jgi:aryl-alcohol dehydrogenase-like predicted oxidoreductase